MPESITPEQLAAIAKAEARAVSSLESRLAAIPFGAPTDTELSQPVDKKLVSDVVAAIRRAGALDAHSFVRVLSSLAGRATEAYFGP